MVKKIIALMMVMAMAVCLLPGLAAAEGEADASPPPGTEQPGQTADGQPADGQPADEQPADEQPTDGQPADRIREQYKDDSNIVLDTSGMLKDQYAISSVEKKLSSRLLRLTDEKYLPSGMTKEQYISQLKKDKVFKENKESGISGESVHVYINLSEGASFDILAPYVTDIIKDESQMLAAAWVDTGSLKDLAELDGVRGIELVTPPVINSGSVNSEGDSYLKAAQARGAFGLDGSGVKVGIISDGVDHWTAARDSGDLPSDVHVLRNSLDGSFNDEGTAMLEIVHDLAPGAELYFHDCGDDIIEFCGAIDALVAAGCGVICDDVSWITQPFFEDGDVAKHVADVLAANDVIYCTSAGNQAWDHYQGKYVNGGYGVADLGHGNKKNGKYMWVNIPYGQSVRIILQWNDRFGYSGNDYDLYLYDEYGDIADYSIDFQTGDDNPIEGIWYTNYSYYFEDFMIGVVGENNSARTSNKTLEIYVYDCNTYPNNIVASDSIYGHAAVPGVITCGAIDTNPNDYSKYYKYGSLEFYSSRGPVTMIGTTRKKPDVCGSDGVSITGAGGFGEEGRFYGTSAASPHIAAIAALLKQRFPSKTPSQIKQIIQSNATDCGSRGYDYSYGSGRANALYSAKSYSYIEFDSNGGSAVSTQIAATGSKIKKAPPNPVKDTFVFGGWYTSPAFAKKIRFPYKVTSDATLYAKWLISPYLSDIGVSDGFALSPAFKKTTYKYAVKLDEFTDRATITPVKENAGSEMTINGQAADSYTTPAINNGGTRVVTIKVKADGMTKVYTVKVTRAKSTNKDLASLTATYGSAPLSFDVPFDKDTLSYNLALDAATPYATIKAAGAPYSRVYINGSLTKSRTFKLGHGRTATATIKVYAQAGGTPKVYTVRITRA